MITGPHCHEGGIRGNGPQPADVLVCGIAPGGEEMDAGEPLVGPTGRLWQSCLKAVNMDHASTYRTNLICHWNNAPDEDEIAGCHSRLMAEVEAVKPKLIIPLGTLASQAFTGRKISEVRGQPLYYKNVLGTSHSCRVMPTWHPAAFLHDGGQTYIVDIIRDLAKLMPPPIGQDLLSWPTDHGKFYWKLCDDPQAVALDFENIPLGTPIAIDIETGNADNSEEMVMDVQSEQMLCFATACIIDGQTWSTTFTPRCYDAFVAWYKANGHRFKWITHYGFFDKQGLKQFMDIDLPIDYDTLARSYTLDERQGVHRLKTLAREYTGGGWWEQPVLDSLERWKANSTILALFPAFKDEPLFDNDDLCSPASTLDKKRGEDGKVKSLKKGEYLFEGTLADVLEAGGYEFHKSRRTMDDDYLAWYNKRLEFIKHPSWDIVPRSILYPYNGEDAARTAQLLPILTRMLEDDGCLQVAEFLERDIDANADIAYSGVHMDMAARDDLCIRWGEDWNTRHDKLQKWATDEGYVNDDGTPLNLNSPRQKATFIYDMLGVPLPESKKSVTKTGQRTTSVKLLDTVKDSHDWLTEYIDFVHLDHSMGAYVLPLPSFVRANDFIHPVWKPHAARTFRDAYAMPPLHQIPGYDETGGAELQALFDCPSEPSWGQAPRIAFTIHDAIYCYIPDGNGGWIFVAADYERAEFYIMAYISHDANLLSDVTSFDMHKATAANVLYKVPYNEVTKWQRYFAKRFNFGKCLDPKTPVLRDDLTWTAIGELVPGKKVLGFTEHVKGNEDRGTSVAEVVQVFRQERECLRIETTEGVVVCGRDHPWLVKYPNGATWEWKMSNQLRAGYRIGFEFAPQDAPFSASYKVGYLCGVRDGDGNKSDNFHVKVLTTDSPLLDRCEQYLSELGYKCSSRTHEGYNNGQQLTSIYALDAKGLAERLEADVDDDWARGYLAGMLDTDGNGSQDVRFSNNADHIIQTVSLCLDVLGFDYTVSHVAARPKERTVCIRGGGRVCRKLLSLLQPALIRKVLPSFRRAYMGEATILNIENVGRQETVDIETTTHTFFAAGLASHNSYGMQPDTMAKEWLHCSVREAQELDFAWNQRYSGWVDYTREIRKEAIQTGEIVSPLTGCKRRFRLVLGKDSFHELNQAINFNIQNGACWVTKNARVNLHERFKSMVDVSPVQVLDAVQSIMCASYLPGIPGLAIDMKVGTKWSDAHSVKRSDDGWHFAHIDQDNEQWVLDELAA